MKKAAILILGLFFLHNCIGQFVITGRVITDDGHPLQGASVSGVQGKILDITDTAGNFSFTSAVVNQMLFFSYVGFETVGLKVSENMIPTVRLVRNSPFLEEAIVRAFEHNTEAKSIPASITVLNKASLERYGNTGFVPALSAVPGVKMDERSPGSYRLSIRGNLLRSAFGVRNVKMYWNGIPLTDANGNTYFNEVAFNHVGKIEVIKGPSGSMYGAGTGGVVLLTSPLLKDKGKHFIFQSAIGSYGMFANDGSYSSSTDKSNSFISFSRQQSGGYRDHTNMRRDVINYAGILFISPEQNISANIFYSDLYYQTPGGLNPAEVAANPRQARPAAGTFPGAAAQKAALYLKTLYVGVANEYQLNSWLNNITGLYISHTNFKNPTIRNFERKTEQGIGMRSVLRYKRNIFSAAFGGEYQYSFNNTSTFGNKSGVADTLQYHDEIDSRQFNIFLQAGITIRKLLVSSGVSYNNYHYGFLRLSDAGSLKEGSNFTPQFVPRISISRELSSNVNVYVVVSKGYSPPSIDEVHASDGVFNRALGAETGINYEAGIKSNPVKNKLWADVTCYIFSLQQTIVSRRDASGADFYVNAGKTKQKGLEVSVKYIPVNNDKQFMRRLMIWSSYTNINAKFSEYQQGNIKYDGNRLTGTPPNVLAAGIDFDMAAGLFANCSYSYTDAIPLNDANTFFASHYNLLYLKGGFKTSTFRKIAIEIYVAAERSFNKNFSLGNDLNAAGNRFYNPSAPHNITVGAKIRLKVK